MDCSNNRKRQRKRRRNDIQCNTTTTTTHFLMLLALYLVALGSCRVTFWVDAAATSTNSNPAAADAAVSGKSLSSSDTSKISTNNRNSNSNKSNTLSLVQVTEWEVWDKSKNAWTGAADSSTNRWTDEKGHPSPSPSELQPPNGWEFAGDWKIVVQQQHQQQHSPTSSASGSGGGGGTDAMGWEYQFHYLRPPTRRRIWLRKMQKTEKTRSSIVASQSSVSTLPRQLGPAFLSTQRIWQRIKDDWNFKGYGVTLYKSFIFPESFGVGLRLPLTANLEYFDSRPGLPSITCGTALYFPWTVMGFLSVSVHVEWCKWVLQSILALVPRLILYFIYKVVLPLLRALAMAILFPWRHRFPLVPATIPRGFWTIPPPRYNSEISERLGVSISYRWTQGRTGCEFRVSYSHSYLPTFAIYQLIAAQTQHKLHSLLMMKKKKKRTTTLTSSTSFMRQKTMEQSLQQQQQPQQKQQQQSGKDSPNSLSMLLSNNYDNDNNNSNNNNDWWNKYFARLGVSTGYPTTSPPYFSCSAILSLSGLYFNSQQQQRQAANTSSSHVDTSSSKNNNNNNKATTTTTTTTTNRAVSALPKDDKERSSDESKNALPNAKPLLASSSSGT
jgi:hypothetical protein